MSVAFTVGESSGRAACTRRRKGALVAGLALAVATIDVDVATAVQTRVCGDADANGITRLTDGVRVLRFAAAFPEPCDVRACDVDGSGVITVTDGVNVLRIAGGLSADAACPDPGIDDFVDAIDDEDGDPGRLELGVAPLPTDGASETITGVFGDELVRPGAGSVVTVALDPEAPRDDAVLIVAVRDPTGTLRDGFFEVPIDPSGDVVLTVLFADELGSEPFVLELATRTGVVVSPYVRFEQRPAARAPVRTPTVAASRTLTPVPTLTPVRTPTPTRTPTPPRTPSRTPTPTCRPLGAGCGGGLPPCCSGSLCLVDPDGGSGSCIVCSGAGGGCNATRACCSGFRCEVDPDGNRCVPN